MLVLRAGNSNIDGLCASGLKLGLGLLDLDVGGNASCIAALDQLQGLLILGNGRIQKLLFGIQEAGLEIVQGQLGMHGQVHGGEVGCAGLCLVARGLDGAAHASPNVELVGELERNLKIVGT